MGCSREPRAQEHPSVPQPACLASPRSAPATTASTREDRRAIPTEFPTPRPTLRQAPCLPQRAIERARHPRLCTQATRQRGRQHSDPGHALALHPIHGPIWCPRPARAPLRRGDEEVSTAHPTAERRATTRPRPPSPSSRRTRWWMPGVRPVRWDPGCAAGQAGGQPRRQALPPRLTQSVAVALRWPQPRPLPLTTAGLSLRPAPTSSAYSAPAGPGAGHTWGVTPGAPVLGPRAWSTSAVPQAPQRAHAQAHQALRESIRGSVADSHLGVLRATLQPLAPDLSLGVLMGVAKHTASRLWHIATGSACAGLCIRRCDAGLLRNTHAHPAPLPRGQ